MGKCLVPRKFATNDSVELGARASRDQKKFVGVRRCVVGGTYKDENGRLMYDVHLKNSGMDVGSFYSYELEVPGFGLRKHLTGKKCSGQEIKESEAMG